MRKPHNRWTVLAGAAAVSLAAFGFPALAAATEDVPPPAHTVHHNQKSTYLVDGYRVSYLPPGLDRYASASTTSGSSGSDHVSQRAWVSDDTVHGSVEVRRHPEGFTLSELRDNHHDHLEAPRRTTVNGFPAYLSAADGEVFWVDGHDTALSVFLDPDRWSSDELMEMAEGIVPHEETDSTVSVTRRSAESPLPGTDAERFWLAAPSAGPEGGSAQTSEEEQPRLLPAPADAPLHPYADITAEEQEVVACLGEETGEEIPTEGGVATPWGSATWNSGLWALVPMPTREAAAECAERTGLDQSRAQEMAARPGSADSSGSAPSDEGVDRSSADSGKSAERNEDSEQRSLWDLLPRA